MRASGRFRRQGAVRTASAQTEEQDFEALGAGDAEAASDAGGDGPLRRLNRLDVARHRPSATGRRGACVDEASEANAGRGRAEHGHWKLDL